MILHLSGDVNPEMFNSLVRGINDLRKDDNLHIYFTSQGGLTDVAEAIIDLVNKNQEYIGMTFYGEIFSSGMLIFLQTQCQKWLLKDARGMYHFAWQELIIGEGGKPLDDYDIFCMKEMKRSKERTLNYLKTYTTLTDKEIAKVRAGKDVYFNYDRMLELINGKRELNNTD